MKHYNIPIFIPDYACPHQCLFCNQKKISGHKKIPSIQEIKNIVDIHLSSIPQDNSHIEIAFFGGNFTGIKLEYQKQLLESVQQYIVGGFVDSIRISTRPDFIDQKILKLLKKHNVKTVELGVQSFDDEVLFLSNRGHSAKDIEKASEMILNSGFKLGLQMMIGLPGDTIVKSRNTAERIIELGAESTRIYPVLVIKETGLELLYRSGKYFPLSLEEAVNWSKELIIIFENSGINILRVGLHPSEGLLNGNNIVAGPFHVSFRELAETEIWREIIESMVEQRDGANVYITVPSDQINYAIGFKSKNREILKKSFTNVKFKVDNLLKGRNCYVDFY